MTLDPELDGLVKIFNDQISNGKSIHGVAQLLEKEGFSHEKIQQAIMIVDSEENFSEENSFYKRLLVGKSSSDFKKPLFIFAGIHLVFLIIAFIALNSFLSLLLKIPLKFTYSLVLILIFFVLGVGSFVLNAFILQLCARLFIKNESINKFSTAMWILLISMSATMYFILIMALSLTSKSILIIILLAYAMMFLFNLGLISFLYRIGIFQALLLSIVYNIAQTVVSWIVSFIVWVIILILFKVAFVAGPTLL